jgi:hypothetical protein
MRPENVHHFLNISSNFQFNAIWHARFRKNTNAANDIARNKSIKDMKNILEFVMNANHTNVIIMSAPHRHDLIKNSCVNKEVKAFNRKLCKRLKRFEKVKMIEVISERAVYTKHGQHLNTVGNEIM